MKFITIKSPDQEITINLDAIVILNYSVASDRHYYYIRTIEGTNHSINEEQYKQIKSLLNQPEPITTIQTPEQLIFTAERSLREINTLTKEYIKFQNIRSNQEIEPSIAKSEQEISTGKAKILDKNQFIDTYFNKDTQQAKKDKP